MLLWKVRYFYFIFCSIYIAFIECYLVLLSALHLNPTVQNDRLIASTIIGFREHRLSTLAESHIVQCTVENAIALGFLFTSESLIARVETGFARMETRMETGLADLRQLIIERTGGNGAGGAHEPAGGRGQGRGDKVRAGRG